MGELISFLGWKKRKECELHEKEMKEIRSLREQLVDHLEEVEDLDQGLFTSRDEKEAWAIQTLKIMITAVDNYKHWPIDSSDM
jgi:hypothetical protein